MSSRFPVDNRTAHEERIIVDLGPTEHAVLLAGAGRPLYSRSEQDLRVRLVLEPGARWVAEYYETEALKEHKGGRLEVVIPTKRLPWLARLVLSLGPEVSAMGPPELEEAVREVARKALAVYDKRALAGT